MEQEGSTAPFTSIRWSVGVRKLMAVLTCSAVPLLTSPPATAQISHVSQILSTALEPLRHSLDLLNSSGSTLLNNEEESAAELLAGATALAAYIAEGGFLNNTIVTNSQKVLRTVAKTANNVIQHVKLQPTEDGRRRAIVFNAFEKSPLDQAIINAVGEVGSFHWTSRLTRSHREDGSTQPGLHGLQRLNAALTFHGLPPLPNHLHVADADSAATETDGNTNVVYLLAMKVSAGEGLPPDVLAHCRDMFEPSVFKTLSLPPVPMPRVGEGLADSPWPSPHRTGFAQASSPHRGPDGKKRLVHNFLNKAVIANNPITLYYTEDQKYLWGSSWTTVFKVARGKNSLRLVDYVAKPIEKVFADKFHGAYALLTREEVFVVSSGDHLEAYYDKPGSKEQQIMMHPQVFDISEELKDEKNFPQRPEEVIRALCMSSDGHIVWATSHGRVGVVSRHVRNGGFSRALHWLMLGRSRNYAGDLEISNNMACDDANGIYVVSDKLMHRVDWDGQQLHIRWEKEYTSSGNSTQGTKAVRLGAGSGSTPSLMGHGERKFVVITDDADVMNVVVMDANDGQIKATHPITFGDPNVKHTSSEQSVLVHGWRLAVVNNTPTRELLQAPNFIKLLGAPAHLLLLGNGTSHDLHARISEAITNAWPVLVGDAPKGVQQLEFDPRDNTLRVTWVNKEVSIPNGIPTMSAASSLMYGIGKRGHLGGDAAPLRGMWTLEAIDWWTGESRYYYNIGIGPMVNSIYAATQVGPREIITGTVGGIVRIKEL